MLRYTFLLVSGLICTLAVRCVSAEEVVASSFETLAKEYHQAIQPLLKTHCLECHSTAAKEGELDLERYDTFAAVRHDPAPWQKVIEMVTNGEMPPEKQPPLSTGEQEALLKWTRRYVDAEALASAGDPGPVTLRRLNNAEFNHTIHDLTGVDLQPAHEFPVDGAAGEGFTNTGNALVMSPALVTKYLDAGKAIASHAVLLPAGIRFSVGATRRDWTNEIVDKIRATYIRHTSGNLDVNSLNQWSVADPKQATQDDGRVDLSRYFSVLIKYREKLQTRLDDVDQIATAENVNPIYLRKLAEVLVLDTRSMPLLEDLRRQLQTAKVDDAPQLAAAVRAWQDRLWKFNTVGHFGNVRPWQVPENPVSETVNLRTPLSGSESELAISLLATSVSGEGRVGHVLWQRPRIEFKDRPAIMLRDVPLLTAQVAQRMQRELPRTAEYLTAVIDLHRSEQPLGELAAARQLDQHVLQQWTKLVGLGERTERTITGHMQNKLTGVSGYAAINGWDVGELPAMLTNNSNDPISFTTLTVPARSVTVHPSPQRHAAVGWRSPIAGRVHIAGLVADADDKCGNGAAWGLELLTANGRSIIATGEIDNGRTQTLQSNDDIEVQVGDIVSLIISARNRNHSCDTTHVSLTIQATGDNAHKWDLATDVVDRIGEGSRISDGYQNLDVWHFYTLGDEPQARTPITPGSLLASWQNAARNGAAAEQLSLLTMQVQAALTGERAQFSAADGAVADLLMDWSGPMQWTVNLPATANSEGGAHDLGTKVTFGRHPAGGELEVNSFVTATGTVMHLKLPAALVRGGEFVVDAAADAVAAESSAVQAQVLAGHAAATMRPISGIPFLARNETPARTEILAACDEFRNVFPAAMCYARIVPVDEVVTLILFHREDEHLCRLMLTEPERQHLDALWEELRFVSRDALTIVTGYEQLMEFATQDADPSIFEPLREPIQQHAAAFRQRLLESEPVHLEGVIHLAERAVRRPLTTEEATGFRTLYARLRADELPHEDAIQLLLVKVFASPAFLYRLEQPGPGTARVAVNDYELANRLSYCLWSSMPDDHLRASAAHGMLHTDKELLVQTRRMLQDDRVRRMALEFACQWLHVRDFDQHNEKSEQHFPEFSGVQADLHEESILFFTDLFQRDGSVLDILAADYVFVNGNLAKHYGIPGVEGEAWHRVEQAHQYSRGGILALGTTLATQSGASRTSPILRGNWISETILGERLPRPPKDVPQLPETVPDNLTERQLIELHSGQPACAKCHARIDPYGFSLENFDAIGRYRTLDAGQHPIVTQSVLPDGTQLDGIAGLRDYLVNTRRDAFLRQFCRRLLGYALGRTVQLSDEPLLTQMQKNLRQHDYQFSAALEPLLLSDQFRMIRGRELE